MTLLAKMFIDNYKLLFRIIYAYLGNVEDTKDTLQNVYLKAQQGNWEDVPNDKLLQWLIVIAKNTSKTLLKKNTPIPIESVELTYFYEPEMLDFVITEALNETITVIPIDLREALRFHITDNIPLKKIARDNNIPYTRLRYWRKVLLDSIKPLIRII